jgi:hypothetical protein
MLDKRAAKITLGNEPVGLEFMISIDRLPSPACRRELARAVC